MNSWSGAVNTYYSKFCSPPTGIHLHIRGSRGEPGILSSRRRQQKAREQTGNMARVLLLLLLQPSAVACWASPTRSASALGLRCHVRCAEADGKDLEGLLNAASAVDLGTAASEAQSGLDALQARANARFRALGVSDAPPPPPPPRSAFTTRSSDATRREADAMLDRLRRKRSGEAEVEHAEAISGARRMARSWLDASLPHRAESELRSVLEYVSLRTEVGGEFHLQLAQVIDACGRQSEARRMLARVVDETESSSIRWRAQRQAGEGVGGGGAAGGSELGSLFGKQFGGDQWDR
eukprot:scaffold16061_cov116-Isochrysis_galbana.AAC.4